MKRRMQTLIGLAVIVVLAMGIQVSALATITDDINPQSFSVYGNTVSVMVMNQGKQSASGTVIAKALVDGVVHSGSAEVYLQAGQSVSVQIILGTITEDLDPELTQVSIIDDPNPMGR